MSFFPNARIKIIQQQVTGETVAGEDVIEPVTPAGLDSVVANIQPYSLNKDDNLTNFEELKSAELYKLILPLTRYTRIITARDQVRVVAAPNWPELVNMVLGIEKCIPRGTFTSHVTLVVRRGHYFTKPE